MASIKQRPAWVSWKSAKRFWGALYYMAKRIRESWIGPSVAVLIFVAGLLITWGANEQNNTDIRQRQDLQGAIVKGIQNDITDMKAKQAAYDEDLKWIRRDLDEIKNKLH